MWRIAIIAAAGVTLFAAAGLVGYSAFAAQDKPAYHEVRFFADAKCNGESQIASLVVPETAASCHRFAVAHGLKNVQVKSYAFNSYNDDGVVNGEWCDDSQNPIRKTFEDACFEAFVNGPILAE